MVAVTWFCTESDDEGICKPSREECEAFRAHSQHALPECTWHLAATCFEIGPGLHCAPSAEICESLRAAAERYASQPVGACTLRKSETMLPPTDSSER